VGAIMDLDRWLWSLGLEKYEAAFRENEINELVLPSLTAEDLKELGVTALGHRRILLDAIAALRTNAAGTGPSVAAGAASSTPSARPEDRAERRQVTVMFSDLVGSTALSARLHVEDLRDTIATYEKCAGEIVRRLGGFVAQFTNDGFLAYFGYPQAHEDDAERAVRAGLELTAAVSSLESPSPLQIRVGIATGLVVAGELVGSGYEGDIVGETLNVAARLQGIAEPNTVIIAKSTRSLLGKLFELEDLGVKELKGISAPVRAFAALRPAAVESRFEAFHTSVLTNLIGREEELELLLRRWSKARSGKGEVVFLSGEAGIGKSRLTIALLEHLASEPPTRVRHFCSPQHTSSALFPIIRQMERAAGFAQNTSPKAKLDQLDDLLKRSSTSQEDAALIADMLSIANDGRYPALELSPQQRRRKTLEALTAQLEALARSNPVLMIFEDLQWIDPTSLEVLDRIVNRIKTLPALLIVTVRPDAEPRWIGRPHVTGLILNRLGKRETIAMINNVTGRRSLPGRIKDDIVERTDGIPLFIEEMTKAALEAGNDEAAEQTVAAAPSSSVAVPLSLHASLMARLDRLGPAKKVAQIGAVIGREFDHSLLVAVAQKTEPELASALDRLVEAGLLFRQGFAPHATYLFKHALVQDAAYSTLLREPSRELHARVAQAMESQFAHIAEKHPELLARHFTEAGLIANAARHWGKAGQRSISRSALVEAVEQFSRALAQIERLPPTPALRREQIELQVALTSPLMHVKGYAAPETKAAIERARLLIETADALGEPQQDPLLSFSVLYGFWVTNYVAFNGDAMLTLAAQFLDRAEKQAASGPLMTGHRLVGTSLLYAGQFEEARAHLDRAIELYNPAKHRILATRFGQDARVAALFYRSRALWPLGYPDAALMDADLAVKDARETGQAASLMPALGLTSTTHIHCGRYAEATALLDELIALAEDKGANLWKAFAAMNKDFVVALIEKPANAIEMISSGLMAWRATGATMLLPMRLATMANTYASFGQFDHAWHSIGEAMATIEATKERWYEAEVNRIAGEIALKTPKPLAARAQAYFERALAIARKQQAKSWELRAAMSLARFWRDQGKIEQARELLAPIYRWFTEGFDTRDLKEAKALLQELSA
jgi:class 3 adenylate cyclase/predicted ATPase